MRIAAISDTHGRLPDPASVDPCDVLVIAGDVCGHHSGRVGGTWDCRGQTKWLGTEFRRWLDAVPARHVVATLGNHDWVGQRAPALIPSDLRWTLLVDAGTTIDGVRFYGSPWSPYFNGWAFNSPPGDLAAGEPFLRERWERIPDETNVLIVHGPPLGYGDATDRGERVGSPSLLWHIEQVRPKLSVHGHIHSGRGRWELPGGTTVANVSVLDEGYRLVAGPMYFDV